MNKGYVIVIEGTDGCGKQTQAQLLYDRLSKLTDKVFKCSFPNYDSPSSAPVKMYLGGELGEHASDINAYQASILFATDRLCTYFQTLKLHYEKGEIIIIDRYTPSNALHQAGKLDTLADKDKFLDWLFDTEYRVLGLPEPDKVIFLNVPVEVSKQLREQRAKQQGLKAGTTKDIHEQDARHLINAYNTGMYVALKYGWDMIACIDNDNKLKSREVISDQIYASLTADAHFNEILNCNKKR